MVPRRTKRVIVSTVALVVSLVCSAGVVLYPATVDVTVVSRGTAIEAVYARGSVEADGRVEVRAKVAGTVAVHAHEGDLVTRGAPLADIEDAATEIELAGARARLSSTSMKSAARGPALAALRAEEAAIRARLTAADGDLARATKLEADGSITAADADKTRAAARALSGELDANLSRQRELAIDLAMSTRATATTVKELAARVSDSEVKSPEDGEVLARYVEPHDLVTVGQRLFKIGDTKHLVLELHVDEADVPRVQLGARADVSFYADPDQLFRGSVVHVRPDAERERHTYLVKVKLDTTPPWLRSGMTAEANIIVKERSNVLLAPADAIADGHVWLIERGRAHRREVHVGLRDLLTVEVDGVAEGAQIVRGDATSLRDGQRVWPRGAR